MNYNDIVKNRKQNTLTQNDKIKRIIEESNLPSLIEIETINKCNNDCSFCPANYKVDKRERLEMNDELFEKIINDLSDLQFSGTVSLHSNNEPLLDKKLIKREKYLREKLPFARNILFTNGILLNISNIKELEKYIDCIVVDVYLDDFNVYPKNIIEIEKIINKNITKILIRDKNAELSTRGGLAPNINMEFNNNDCINELCFLPFSQLVVRPNGDISLCCNDVYGYYTLGNLKQNNIIEIWNNEKRKQIQNEMIKNKRKNINLCKDCNSIHSVNFIYENFIGMKKELNIRDLEFFK